MLWEKWDEVITDYYEVKTRRNKMNTYPDTMITTAKLSNDKPIILLFNYTDCLTYIRYDEELFSTFRRESFSRGRINEKASEHIFVPIEKLTVIKNY